VASVCATTQKYSQVGRSALSVVTTPDQKDVHRCKTYGLYYGRKGEGGIIILVRLYVNSYQTLRPWQSYIYTWELYVVITNIQSNNKE
jgi:hypothetical protein